MAIDSKIFERMGSISHLNLVGGNEKDAVEVAKVFPQTILRIMREGVVSIDGVKDRHFGETRKARGYQVGADKKGIEVRNERQVSVVTARDLLQIAADMELVDKIKERTDDVVGFMSIALAANVVVDGSDTPEGLIDGYLSSCSRLYIGAGDDQAILTISENHLPCSKPATAIAHALGEHVAPMVKAFQAAATKSRGYMGEVWAPGSIAIGDPVGVQLPVNFKGAEQKFWTQEAGYKHP